MAGGEAVVLLSVAVGSLILGGCTPGKDLLEGVRGHWRAAVLCIVCKAVLLPAIAWVLCVVLNLEIEQRIGMIIIAAVPSSPISNLWQWLSCAHIGLGAFLTSISNLCALVSVPVTLHLYLGHVLNERFALAPSDVLLYTFAYTAPILAAACLAYIFVPSDAEIHWRWRLLAILTLVFFSFLAFVFVGNKPLGMTINPWELLAGHRARDYAACLLLLVANFFLGYGAGRFFKLPSVVCRTLSIEVAMQNDWLALHIVRGTLSGGQLFLFPIILYSTMQAMSGSMVMLIFKQMYTEERVLEYINENRLHDSFRGPGHFDADDANQVSLQGRHNKAVQKIFGMKMPTRYAKSSWFLRDPTKAVNRNESLTTYENDHGSDDDER